MCIEESIKYARQRNTFGLRLMDHQVIRHKIADMAMRVEALQALLELIAYQMKVGITQDKLGVLFLYFALIIRRSNGYC